MYAVSDAFKTEIQHSHKVATLCEIYSNDVLQATFDIGDGSISVADQPIRRQCRLSIIDRLGTLTVGDATDLLAPYGNEVKLYRGVTFAATGTSELVPQGVFRVTDYRAYDSGQGLTIDIDGYDRARAVSRAALVQDYTIAEGTNYGIAIQTLITYRIPSTQFNFVTTVLTTPLLVFAAGDDPWQRAQEMAASIGCVLYFDVNGICTLQNIADPNAGNSVWDYTEGEEAMFLYIVNSRTDKDVYSHVIRTGEHSSNTVPYRGEAVDDDPNSPTYYLGAFGDVVDFQSSQYITSQAQADAAAAAALTKSRGVTQDVSFNAVVNPAHELFDIITIERAKSKVDGVFMIDRMTVPMTYARPLEVSTRQRTTS